MSGRSVDRGCRTRSSHRSAPANSSASWRSPIRASGRSRILLLATGLRLAEVASLHVGDIRPDGTIRVLGKGSKERIVPLGTTDPPGAPPLRCRARSRRPGGPTVRRPVRHAAQPSRHPVRDRSARHRECLPIAGGTAPMVRAASARWAVRATGQAAIGCR
ncbi:MAG: site-specific integrase [Chloroflexi bacterium]|nr:site-specific integrase [Chloroflexota bacterium]MDA8236536.1 site-specific integrase [Chloroflexota bacterium]